MPKFFNQYTDEIFIFFLELPVNIETVKKDSQDQLLLIYENPGMPSPC